MKYSFVGESEELCLTPGDIITDVRTLPARPGWSEGTLRGERAHFPDSMVELHVTEWYNEEARIFLCKPSDWLYCRSCHQLLVEAQEMSCCEGMFCLKCIEQWNAMGKGHCPGCTTVKWDWHPSRAVERVLKGMHVLCRNHLKGCQWRGELRDLSEHLAKDTGCQYAVVCCPHNCGTDFVRRSLNDHVSTQCSLRPYQCQYCQKKSTYTDIVHNHLPECPMHPVECPNVCGMEGVVRQGLAAHLNNCPLQSIQCSNGCEVQVLRKQLEGHLMNDCVKRQVACEYCEMVSSFEEIMGSHLSLCGHVPLDCPNKCSDQNILRQDLHDHIEKDCPLHVVECEFVGCTARFSRRDRADHVAHNQAAHLSLVMAHMVLCEKELHSSHEMLTKRCAALESQNEMLTKRCAALESQNEMLKKRCAALESQNEAQQEYQPLLAQLKKKSDEALRLKKLEEQQRENLMARRCNLERASHLPPPPEGVPRVFRVNSIDIDQWSTSECGPLYTHSGNCQWSTGPIHIHNIELIFNIHCYTLSREIVDVSLEGCVHHADAASPRQFCVFFELIHPENDKKNATVSFDVQVPVVRRPVGRRSALSFSSLYAEYKVSCSPRRSNLIANIAGFRWAYYMINCSVYFRVTASQ